MQMKLIAIAVISVAVLAVTACAPQRGQIVHVGTGQEQSKLDAMDCGGHAEVLPYDIQVDDDDISPFRACVEERGYTYTGY